MAKIFITGISGCVGHYLFDYLSQNPDYEFYLLVRNPEKIKFEYKNNPKIHIIIDDLEHIGKHRALLKEMDYVVHLAAQWGGNELNYDYTLNLLRSLDENRCRKVIYFSTASILGKDNQPVQAAEKFGTHYIRSKYQIYKKLPELKIYPKVTTIFPTWILGGDKSHPYSHAAEGLVGMKNWAWLIRFFTVDASFHFIHAKDIAAIVDHILKNEVKEKDLVLGNPSISATEFIKQACAFWGKRTYFQFKITPTLVYFLAFIFRKEIAPWDRYCFSQRHFVYKTVNTTTFGLGSNLRTIKDILASL